ncbi:MAG: DUF1850 domain-containing protein [Sedimentibacter sp.]|uniref:DUF1850 domain-containing protein n=1 Tax=Sedimentibacter sp. TaxID=1960295 RepID=UPI00298257E3|nr:DUF1850 domain-containing protein [Sedimentibacter sp.]MDW5298684.1 DUF1850 domain-containing protein [Sedimentibacter sp.]
MKNPTMFVTIMILILFVIIIFFIPVFNQFTISNGKTGDVVYCDSIEKFENFYTSFKHSVNRTPVNEFYRIEGNKFVVYKTTFYSYGAGMPDARDYPDADIKFENGKVLIDNINRELNEFTILVGTYADHTVHVKNESFKLDKYVEPQNPALFKIKRVSIYDILRRQLYE